MAGEKGTVWANGILAVLFNATTMTGLVRNDAPGSALSTLYVSLHTSDPTASGNQASFEANYAPYARVGVARTSAGWTVTGNSVSPVNTINFPSCTSGSSNITNFGIGTAATGAGELLYSGPVTTPLNVTPGIAPQFPVGALVVEY